MLPQQWNIFQTTQDNGRRHNPYNGIHMLPNNITYSSIFQIVAGSIIPITTYSYVVPITARISRNSQQRQEQQTLYIGTDFKILPIVIGSKTKPLYVVQNNGIYSQDLPYNGIKNYNPYKGLFIGCSDNDVHPQNASIMVENMRSPHGHIHVLPS